jgi:2',3'-cyclic-nucleotide 2'-phosphodiesterase (5'-nucleotidase family)
MFSAMPPFLVFYSRHAQYICFLCGILYRFYASQPKKAIVNDQSYYRVMVNSFLADGGDNFLILKEGTDRLGGDVDTDAFEEYFAAHSPVAPGPQNRITLLP